MDVATEPVFEELRPPLGREEALAEADRCLECGGPHALAPCMLACPAGVDVSQFVAAIASDDPERGGGHDLCREPARRHLRPRVSSRSLVRGRVCARRCRSPADRDRSPSAIRHRPRARERRHDSSAGAVERAKGRDHRSRPGRARVRRRARRPRLRRHGLRRARRGRRPRSVRDCAVPPVAGAAARRGGRGGEARRRVPARLARRRRRTRGDRLGGGCRLPRRGNGPRHRGLLSGRRPARRLGVAPIHRVASRPARRRRSGDDAVVVGGGNTAIDVAREALRLGASCTSPSCTGAAKPRCRRTRTR